MYLKIITLFACLPLLNARAGETLPIMTVKGQTTYSNLTITGVTATDVFFSCSNGMGNAKLKDLDPKLQAHFHYDPAKAALAEKQETTNNVRYRQFILTNRLQSVHPNDSEGVDTDDDFVAPKIYARSVLGQRLPVLIVEHWLTPKPNASGKFILLVFWATSSEPCRADIPQINALYEKFQDQLVVIGITDEPEAMVRKMTDPPVKFALAIDTKAAMARTLEITAIPHCILVDPHSFVRYEGSPAYLDDAKLEHFLTKYR
jgi:cytochrome c biogenesis protein CcmG, thiol:disulfide interchange protein DsbE